MLSIRALFLVILASTVVNSASQNDDQSLCKPDTSKTDGLRFTQLGGPADLAIGCANELIELVCCVANFKTITWYHRTDGGKTWTQFKTDNTRNLYERNQVASILHIDPSADRGSYRCVAEGFKTGERIENTVKIDIRDCSSWRGPPGWLYPRDAVSAITANVGDIARIPCRTFTGTNCIEDDMFCLNFWHRAADVDIPENNSSAHVYFVCAYRVKTLEMECILTINGVTEEDFGDYYCTAVNRNDQNLRDRLVILKKDDPTQVVILVKVAIGGGVLLSVAVIVILVTYQRRSDLDFKIWMSARQLGGRPEHERWRVLLINAEDDQQFAMHLKNILETNLKFAVISSCDDVHGYDALVSRIPALAEGCSCVLVLLTPALLGDEVLLAAIRDIIHQATPVFVANGIDRCADRSAYTKLPGIDELGQNLTVALSVSRPLHWPGVNDGSGAGEGGEGWGRRATERQANVFWKKLQLSLLKTIERRQQQQGRHRTRLVRLDSKQPLLQQA